ncbi:large ribosomal subunit protein uL13m isoform X2 [Salminus brasiliensis]|uniref:large ribosomal subunit protein uL13m isoform X2 n=1 Tax=Salminus brasiliensis TaxID=930266 RepID=UPI003B82ED46
MSSFSRSAQQWVTFARSWYLIDARMQPPGKIATMCSVRLQGKHKPIYHALSDVGDHVVVMNSRHIAFSGNKWEQKVYSSHTGYPGGFKQVTAAQLHQKDPTARHPEVSSCLDGSCVTVSFYDRELQQENKGGKSRSKTCSTAVQAVGTES